MEQNGRGADCGWCLKVPERFFSEVICNFPMKKMKSWKTQITPGDVTRPAPAVIDILSFEACSLVVKGIINISFSCLAELLCVMETDADKAS